MRRTKDDTKRALDPLEDVLDHLLDPLTGLASLGEERANDSRALPVLARTLEARGADAFVSVTLRDPDLRGGTRPVVRFTISEPCSTCNGSGWADSVDGACGDCFGTGFVEADRLLALRIPPGLRDGDQVRVRGEGNVTVNGRPGDLYVDVRVVSRTKRVTKHVFVAFGALVLALLVFAAVSALR